MRVLTAVLTATVLLIAGCGDENDDGAPAAGAAPAGAPAAPAAAVEPGQTRRYFIAADQVQWDYAPDGRDRIAGGAFGPDARVFVAPSKARIGSTYTKCLYREYPDETFESPRVRPPEEAHLGYLGPVLRAAVGDTIEVTFKNNCPFPTSMHPHGLLYDKANEGAGYADGSPRSSRADDAVLTGESYTYRWEVPPRAGPGPADGETAAWMYHSHRDEVGDVYAGLNGFLVITAAGKADPDGTPTGIDREIFQLYLVDDENSSPLLEDNLRRLRGEPDLEDEAFVESNLMHAINGYVYGNGPVPQLRQGERVRWYLMAMGSEVDLHTPHWHGNTALVHGMRTDVVNLLPASMATADMVPDALGTWLVHCHVADHITAGMQSRYEVLAN